MKTSYYARFLKHYGKYKEMGFAPVSISVGSPRWWKGPEIPQHKALCPYGLLGRYKDLPEDEANESFHAAFENRLERYDPQKVYEQLQEMVAPLEPVLLCFEKIGDVCHRHQVADWFKDGIGIEIEELELPESDDEEPEEEKGGPEQLSFF